MNTMRELLERLTGRYRFAFKPARPVGAGSFGPDRLLAAQPTKAVRVELAHYAQPAGWEVTVFDEDTPEEDPHGIVARQNLTAKYTEDEAMEAAIEVALKYLGQKGRAVREAIDTDFGDPAAKLDALDKRILQAIRGHWMEAERIAWATKIHPDRVRARLDSLIALEYVERKVAGDRVLYKVLEP